MRLARFGRLTASSALLICAGCDVDVPSGRFVCASHSDCAEGQVCVSPPGEIIGRCFDQSSPEGKTVAAVRDGGGGQDSSAGPDDVGVLTDAASDGSTPSADAAPPSDAASDAAGPETVPVQPTAMELCNGSWIPSMKTQLVPVGARSLASEQGPAGPANQYLCRSTLDRVTFAGKATTPSASGTNFDSGCYIAAPGRLWTSVDTPFMEIFAPVAGCTVEFRTIGRAEPFPVNALPVKNDPASRGIYICRARVAPESGVRAESGMIAGVGTHLGHVTTTPDRLCRFQYYGSVLETADYEILVVGP